jgi:hypothetical protein
VGLIYFISSFSRSAVLWPSERAASGVGNKKKIAAQSAGASLGNKPIAQKIQSWPWRKQNTCAGVQMVKSN